ncbi:hypothetical protein [Streptomyces sp. 7-21]|uniref:hypothetical protein n=1 Tax=Streptomyces sp. 7-21 TaxID=2802283 RepID=UPI00191CE43A|nr:hypothetical protein [Streptomyces sp. 7-21]MBL1065295.1 hypothetical protein [Streptomyces sp. 7-21]
MSDYAIKNGDRDAVIAGLRELADFLADNPRVMVPRYPSLALIVTGADAATRRKIAELVTAPLGVPLEDLGHGYYTAHRDFGPVRYHVTAAPTKDEP